MGLFMGGEQGEILARPLIFDRHFYKSIQS